MRPWTAEQESILVKNSNRGAEFCRDLIEDQYGIKRTIEATRKHANRLGLTLRKVTVCPHCGRGARLNRLSGLCPTCNMVELKEKQKQINSELISQMKNDERKPNDTFVKAQKEYDALRQSNRRLRSRIGNQS